MNDLLPDMNGSTLSMVQQCVDRIELQGGSYEQSVGFSFLRNFTVEGIEPYLKYHCYRSEIKPRVCFGGYDTVTQEILDPSSQLHQTAPDVIVMALVLENLWPQGEGVEQVISQLSSMLGAAAAKSAALIAVNSFLPPFYCESGVAGGAGPASLTSRVARLNQFLRDYVSRNPSRFILIDWERMVRVLGEERSIDYRFWYMSKAPFRKDFLNLYAQELVKVARALKGRGKKCLVLDCDNTLWGGVVGEEGLAGIRLDPHSFPGNTFYEFQRSLISLNERGVLITLCSKNNEEDVWEVLERHPYALLKKSHLSGWRINWNDKVGNIRELARELNLGLDSFVFVDDNPAECGSVSSMIPEVTVLQVPQKLYNLPRLLLQEGLFDTLALSSEDRERARMYQDEMQRRQQQALYDDIEQYLASLELAITVHEARQDEVPRVAQLTQKTNQFNLTTRRYSEEQIARFLKDPQWGIYTLSVSDRFGDSGLTGVLIATREGGLPRIDSYLLSCRVLGKSIEYAFLNQALRLLEAKWGVPVRQAGYVMTKKNQQVARFLEKAGFLRTGGEEPELQYVLPPVLPAELSIPYISIKE